jgi:hypothetical protein
MTGVEPSKWVNAAWAIVGRLEGNAKPWFFRVKKNG